MRGVSALALVLAAASLSGCLGPTYGTGKSAGAQLFDDLDGMLAMGPKNKDEIDYSPRAELVRPKDKNVLPAPQDTVSAANAPNWPESPEQRRARIRANADRLNKGDGPLGPEVLMAEKEGVTDEERARNTVGSYGQNNNGRGDMGRVLTPDELNAGREQFKKRLAESRQGSAASRKYLSEPPLAYRQPSASAPVGDPGVDEDVKQRRLDGNDKTLLQKLKGLNPF